MNNYELVVIGSGPAGEKAAVKAAYFGRSVAIVEQSEKFGGAGVNTGTLPSKTLKETALYYSGKNERGLFGVDKQLERRADIKAFMYRKNEVVSSEGAAVERNLRQHGVDIYHGTATFEDAHTLRIDGRAHGQSRVFGDHIIIATGSYPFHPDNLPFDGELVHDSDTILQIDRIPTSLCVLGAGVIGCEYATIFSTAGANVLLVNKHAELLPFVDREIADHLVASMQANGVETVFGTGVERIEVPENGEAQLRVVLDSGRVIEADMFLFAAGRCGNTRALGLDKIGLETDSRELIKVGRDFRTNVPNIWAVGDVIGFPALASTSMDQGRAAVAHIFNLDDLKDIATIFPYGIYTIPEVSMVGVTEAEATRRDLDYAVGRAMYRDVPRGKIMGAEQGFLKLVFRREDKVVIGVHIVGPLASELIHYGVSLVENEKTLDEVITRVFNYPTLHDLYKYASYDGLGALAGRQVRHFGTKSAAGRGEPGA